MKEDMNTSDSYREPDPEALGARIRDIRRLRHLTQAELARRVGIQPGPMNALERGRHIPSGRVLYRLAAVLEVSMDALFGRPPEAGYVRAAASSVCARADGPGSDAAGAPVGEPQAVLLPPLDTQDPGTDGRTVADELARAVLALEDLCGAQKRAMLPLHLPFVADDAGVEELVARVRHLLGISQAVVFDYLELVENAGLRVLFADLPGRCDSLACFDRPNGNAFLFVRNSANAERQLFRLLFELGRIYWHAQGLYASESGGRGPRGPLDEKHMARKFAARFLMPSPAVRATVRQLGIGPDAWTYELVLRIKHRFGVSAESFCIRLEELGLITRVGSEAVKKRIQAHYRAHAFAEPDASRRVLFPNGRAGDLLLHALQRPGSTEEAQAVADVFDRHGVRWGDARSHDGCRR